MMASAVNVDISATEVGGTGETTAHQPKDHVAFIRKSYFIVSDLHLQYRFTIGSRRWIRRFHGHDLPRIRRKRCIFSILGYPSKSRDRGEIMQLDPVCMQPMRDFLLILSFLLILFLFGLSVPHYISLSDDKYEKV